MILDIFFIFLALHACYSEIYYKACCRNGMEKAEMTIKNATLSNTHLSTMCTFKSMESHLERTNKSKSFICALFARSCCIKVYSTRICQLGASQKGRCEEYISELSPMLNQIKMECCMCCKGGKGGPLFDSCSLLKGNCSRPYHEDKSRSMGTSTTPSSDRLFSAQFHSYQPRPTTATVTNDSSVEDISNENAENNNTVGWETSSSTFALSHFTSGKTDETLMKSTRKMSEISPKANTMTTTSDTTMGLQSTSNLPIVCDKGKKWDPLLQVCVQLIISCPKNFILHPNTSQCVPMVRPKVPCSKGFAFNQFLENCRDIDECETANTCPNNWEICVNTLGSFRCDCQKGFKHSKLGICEDIDECINANICQDDKKCKNIIGSYKCIRSIPCGFGWKEDPDSNDCVDVDECEAFPEICGSGMKCVNIRGSHRCEDDECPKNMKRNNKGICSRCKDGFYFKNETRSCEDIDECTMNVGWYNGRCKETEICFNLPGSYDCIPKKKCRPGTVLARNGIACNDIDECKQMKFRCESDEICVNTYSSYHCVASPCAPSQQFDYSEGKCICRDGYHQNQDHICTDIDECAENGGDNLCGSLFLCINHPGSYACIHRAECPSGMFRSSMYSNCQDVDECETGEGKCAQNMHCVNIVGSYKCMCDRGYVLTSNNTCTDVNECLLFRPEESCPDLEARCVNTPGSYKCQCPKGFQWSDYPIKKCTDINECLAGNPCGKQHQCVNMVGSYKCKCFQGYRLSISGDTCEDIDECLLEPRKCLNGICVNVPGRYECKCPQGFTADRKEICQDIDECSASEGVCSREDDNQNGRLCINLLGYYKCVNSSCPDGYSKKETGNGFICELKSESRCKPNDIGCLSEKPYKISYEFIEISSDIRFRRAISRFNMSHLPLGSSRINLKVKYALNTNTKQPVYVKNVFQLDKDRDNQNNIEVVMKKMIEPPVEILLYLDVKRYHREMFLGHSEGFMNLFLTRYPSN